MKPLHVSEVDMARARRKLKRRIAASLITAMAETDADYEFIAKRLKNTPAEMERWITGLISGKTLAMDEASDLLLAMGCEFRFELHRYEEPVRPRQEDDQNQPAAA